MGRQEKRSDFVDLLRWRELLPGDDALFAASLKLISARGQERLTTAREWVRQGYGMTFQFATTGTANNLEVGNQRDWAAAGGGDQVGFEFYGDKDLISLFEDYLDGVRPIAELRLAVAPQYIKTKADTGRRTKTTDQAGMEMGVYLVPGDAIAAAVRQYGPQLFSRNIRGHLADTNDVNSEIASTIAKDTERFRYMNNGLTIICDFSEFSDRDLTEVVLANPSENGQIQRPTHLRQLVRLARRPWK